MKRYVIIVGILIALVPKLAMGETTQPINSLLQSKVDRYSVEYTNDIPNMNSGLKEATTNAVVNYGDRTIKVRKSLDTNYKKHSLLHEEGHVLDTYMIGDTILSRHFSSIDRFKEIFDKEKLNLEDFSYDVYYTDDIHEYFAESFAMYIENPSRVKRLAPLTYGFIDELYNNGVVSAN